MLGWKHPFLCKVSKRSQPHIEVLAEKVKVGVSSETQQTSESSSQASKEHWLQHPEVHIHCLITTLL